MKRLVVNSLILFIVVFLAIYLIFGYLPSFRIKLAAPPMEYFAESIKHMVGFKTLVSVVVGLLVACIALIFQRRAK